MEFDVVGLSDETQLVYTALVGRPRSTASQVAGGVG